MTSLRELEQAATPGPWQAWPRNTDAPILSNEYRARAVVGHPPRESWEDVPEGEHRAHGLFVQLDLHQDTVNADAALIAASRNALPALLDVVDAARWLILSLAPTQEDPFPEPWQRLDTALAILDRSAQ